MTFKNSSSLGILTREQNAASTVLFSEHAGEGGHESASPKDASPTGRRSTWDPQLICSRCTFERKAICLVIEK